MVLAASRIASLLSGPDVRERLAMLMEGYRLSCVVFIAALALPSSAQEFPKMDESWTVKVNGQSVQVSDDGSFTIPNVSVLDQFGGGGPGTPPDFISDEYLRVVDISTEGGRRATPTARLSARL